MYSSRRNSRGSRVDDAIAAFGGTLDQVELEWPCPQRRFAQFRRTAQQRLDPGDEFDEREGFGEIVVATHPQSAHTVVHRAQRAQHQHRGTHLVLAQRLDDRKSVHSGQQPIDDHGVRPRRSCLVEAIDAVGRPFDFKTTIGQLRGDFLSRFAIILDQQHFCHQSIPDCGENIRRSRSSASVARLPETPAMSTTCKLHAFLPDHSSVNLGRVDLTHH